MRHRKKQEIIFKHIEVDEEISPIVKEMVEDILAESLFQSWLKELGNKNGETKKTAD